MADDFVGISISGAQEIADKLDKLPPEAADAGVEAADEYLVNYEQTKQPPYSYVGYNSPGMHGFYSNKQRMFVMMSLREGSMSIPYSRTQGLRNAWKTVGEGKNQIVVNDDSAAPYVKGDATQSQMMMLRNWTIISEDIRDTMEQILRKFDAGVSKAIHALGLD